jgi:penicillin-binding protein 1A
VVLLILMVSGVTVASAAAITAGSAAAVTLTQLEEGLPDPRSFQDLDFNEQSVMYDRSGRVRLAEFWNDRRDVIDNFDSIPKVVLDATTATEDDTFWTNPGVDLEATMAQLLTVAGGGDGRGASTITQQLVRAVLLPEDVLREQFASDEGLYTRKAKEIIQAYRLTQAFPGEEGKEEIITAYLNQIPYGGAIHGIKAAADVYFGKDLEELSLAQVALLAAIPQEPANLYPYAKNKKGGYANLAKIKSGKGKNKKVKYVLKQCGDDRPSCVDTEVVRRQHFIIDRLAEGKGRWVKPTAEQVEAAKNERIFVKKEQPVRYKAPQFVNAAVKEVNEILGNDYDPIDVGGYKITTTLDWKAQTLGQDLIWAGAVAPHLPITEMYAGLRKRGLSGESSWVARLRPLGVYSGALVAMDYRTGDLLAYVAAPPGYYKKNKNQRVDYRYDHIGLAKRQPGSSWKPIVYAAGIDSGRLTAASVLLDITTPFGGRNDAGETWVPKNAEKTDSGPIAVRDALQQSLNVPAIRALAETGIKTVRKYAVKAGYEFLPEPVGFGNKALDVAGLAGAIGTVEVRPLDHVKAFGSFGNNGKVTRPRYVLEIKGPKGGIIYKAGRPVSTQVWSPQTAYIITDILKGNADPRENAVWANVFAMNNTRNGSRRELAVKTGTTNNLKDYSTYGYLPKPKNANQPALAVGVWYGNSNSRAPNVTNPPIYSMSNAGETWHAFVTRYMNNKPAPTFQPPKSGVVRASVRTPNGSRSELFVRGTQPGGSKQVDPAYSCGSINSLEVPGAWWPSTAVNSWAARGVGSSSQWQTIKTKGSCFGGSAPSSPSGSSSSGGSSSSSSGGSGGGSGSGGGGGGGGVAAPTCQPGFTDKPRGCRIPG